MKHWYIRPTAEPRTHNATPARTAMIQSIHGQACASSDRMERVLLAIFDVLTDQQQDRALRLLGWEATSRDGALGVTGASALRPLTLDRIEELWEALEHKAPVYLARAVEAAHGIGVKGLGDDR